MALQADKDGFLVGGAPVALDKEGFRRAYDIMMGMQKDIAAIRKALVSGAATASAATPIRRGASVSAFTSRQAVAIAKEAGDRAGKAVSVSRARDSKGKFIAGASTSQQAAAVVTASTKLAAKIAQEQAAQAKRDGKGRFTSGGRGYDHAESASKPGFMRRMFGRLRERLGDAGAAAGELEDTAATVDPGAAAAKETREMLAPIAQAGAGLFKLFGGEKSEEEKAEEKVAKKVHVPWYKKMLRAMGRGGLAASDGIGGMLSKIPGIGALGSLLGGGMGGLLGRGAGLVGKGGLIGAAALGGWEIGSMIYERFAPQIAEIVDKSVAFAQGAWETVTKKWNDVVAGWNSLTEDIGKKWTTITDAIGEKFGVAKQAVINVYEQTVTKTSQGIETAANAANRVKTAAKDAYRGAVNTASQGIEYVADKAGQAKDWAGNKAGPLLDLIGKEGGEAGYDASWNGSKVKPSKPMSQMTLGEVMQWQQDTLSEQASRGVPASKRSSAAGRYQFISSTLKAQMKAAGLSENDMFSPENQDKMAMGLLNESKTAGYDAWKSGKATDAQFQDFVASKWALFQGSNGRGKYDDPGFNHAAVSGNQVIAAARAQSAAANIPPAVSATASAAPSAASMKIPAAPPALIAANPGKESRQSQQVLVGNTIGQNMADRAIAQLATGGMASNLGT